MVVEKKAKLVKRITLIELLLILMLSLLVLSVVVSIFGLNVKKKPYVSPEVKKINKDIIIIENGLRLYKLDNGVYPTKEQGLSALIRKPTLPPIPQVWNPYLKEMPVDPWGRPYQYLNPGKSKAVEVYTLTLPPPKKPADKLK